MAKRATARGSSLRVPRALAVGVRQRCGRGHRGDAAGSGDAGLEMGYHAAEPGSRFCTFLAMCNDSKRAAKQINEHATAPISWDRSSKMTPRDRHIKKLIVRHMFGSPDHCSKMVMARVRTNGGLTRGKPPPASKASQRQSASSGKSSDHWASIGASSGTGGHRTPGRIVAARHPGRCVGAPEASQGVAGRPARAAVAMKRSGVAMSTSQPSARHAGPAAPADRSDRAEARW